MDESIKPKTPVDLRQRQHLIHRKLEIIDYMLSECMGNLSDHDTSTDISAYMAGDDGCELAKAAAAVIYANERKLAQFEELARLTREQIQRLKRNYPNHCAETNEGRLTYLRMSTLTDS